MSSPIESLPTELFDAVLRQVHIFDVVSLQQCSRSLHQTLRPYIYSQPETAHTLMCWACARGQIWAIEKALSLGADVSLIDVLWIRRQAGRTGPSSSRAGASTLTIAARKKHPEALEFLLKSGARPDARGVRPTEVVTLANCVFKGHDPRMAQSCWAHGIANQLPDFQWQAEQKLFHAVKMGLSMDRVRAWVDMGARSALVFMVVPPSTTMRTYVQSPLALAMLRGPSPLFELLLANKPGVTVNAHYLRSVQADLVYPEASDEQQRQRPQPWDGYPMLAAARRMATHRTTDMMERMLGVGGNINETVERTSIRFEEAEDPSDTLVACGPLTPLHAYVLSLDFTIRTEHGLLRPADGVKYLLERGASVSHSTSEHAADFEKPMSLLGMLWRRWHGMQSLVLDDLYAVLKLLINNGAAKSSLEEFLLRPKRMFAPVRLDFVGGPLSEDEYRTATRRWRTILDLALTEANMSGNFQEGVSQLLFELTMSIFATTLKAGARVPNDPTPRQLYRWVDEGDPVLMQMLLLKGADLNWVSSEPWHYRRTALRMLMSQYGYFHRRQSQGGARLGRMQARRQRSLVSMLVRMGAEPPKEAQESDSEGADQEDLVRQRWLMALRGVVAEEEELLWDPTAGFLLDGSWKTDHPREYELAD